MQVDDRRTPDHELGAAVAAGRDATLHDAGPGRVLRRTPTPRDLRIEAKAMEHVRAAGYPVPEVFRVGPGELLLERIEGPTMLADLERRPWRARAHARTLADLHARLHAIAPPSWLPTHPIEGGAIAHLDLHPGNVLLSPSGPVVIDWTNVKRSRPEVDVALTWILMAAFDREPPGPGLPWRQAVAARAQAVIEPKLRGSLVRSFLAASGLHDQARAVLASTAEVRLEDRSVRPGEAAAIRSLVAREAPAVP